MTTSTGRRGFVGIDRRWLADPNLSDSALRLMLWLDSHSDEYLMAMNMSRAAEEMGWSRNRVKRTVEELEQLGLISATQQPRQHGGTVTYFTLHHEVWSDAPSRTSDIETDGPPRTSAVVHGGARAVVHGGARTTSNPSVVETNSQEPPLPPVGGRETEPFMGTFEDWYASYPRKQGKDAARRKWARLTPEQRAACVAAQPRWNAYWQARNEPQFIPMASTWVNQARWDDDVPSRVHQPATRNTRSRSAIERLLTHDRQELTS